MKNINKDKVSKNNKRGIKNKRVDGNEIENKEEGVGSVSKIMYIKVRVHLIRITPGLHDKNESPPPVEDSIFENGENIDKHAFINRTQRSQPITHPQDTNLGHQSDVCRCSLPTLYNLNY